MVKKWFLKKIFVLSEDPDDSSISGQGEKHEDDVEEAQGVMKERVGSFKSPPIRVNVIQIPLQ